MIGFIEGIVKARREDALIISCGGVGYLVLCGSHIASTVDEGQAIELFIETKVKETDISLYGFREQDEQDLFNHLLKVQGVGGKVALSILSKIEYNDFCQAVLDDNVKAISRADGVGPKMAHRIVSDLKKFVENVFDGSHLSAIDVGSRNIALQGLKGLGFSEGQASDAFEMVAAANGNAAAMNGQELIKKALVYLGR
jgi:Holliday junction DNA helicase RuvA